MDQEASFVLFMRPAVSCLFYFMREIHLSKDIEVIYKLKRDVILLCLPKHEHHRSLYLL